MANRRRLDSIRPRAIAAAQPIERRDHQATGSLARRIRGEFQEMPGTSLTAPQASRLFAVPPEVGIRILRQLVDEGFLRMTSDRRYRLAASA